MQSSSRLPHLVRGTSAASIATFSALFSHVLGGGEVPGFLGVVAPFVLSLLVCVLLSGRRLSLLRLSISVVASQTLFHTLFVLGTPGPGGSTSMPGGHQHGHGMPVMSPITDETIAHVHGDPTMWGSHLVGAGITIFFLYRCEQTLHLLRELAELCLAWMRHRLADPFRLPLPAASPVQAPAVESAPRSFLSRIDPSALGRRGPPSFTDLAR